MSSLSELVVAEAREYGSAYLKVIQPNDVGITGGHQKGFHLSKKASIYFTAQLPTKGINHDDPVELTWTDGTITHSTVKWYGRGTRSEYRLTGFNRIHDFYYIHADRLGGVLVLIRVGGSKWRAHVLEHDRDIEDVEVALGVDLADSSWALYMEGEGVSRSNQTVSDCEVRAFTEFASSLDEFPGTRLMAETARRIARACRRELTPESPDEMLMHHVTAEYDLFRMIEQRLVHDLVTQSFDSVDEFLAVAQTILQRRKSRAGKSLEWHLEALLSEHGIPFDSQATVDGTKPDVLIPGKIQYSDADFPDHKLFVVGIKTTCRDRWRQVLEEAPRVSRRYIVTLQKGISGNQLRAMTKAGVQLVVPSPLHQFYAPEDRARLWSVEELVLRARAAAA